LNLIAHRKPAARREHRCQWCGEPIVKGEKHRLTVYCLDGKIVSDRLHDECHEAFQGEFEYYGSWTELGFDPYANDRGQPAKEGTIHES